MRRESSGAVSASLVVSLLLMSCDPIGTLKVIVVADGPGPSRVSLPAAKGSVLRPGFGPALAESAGVPAQFRWSRIPGIGFDTTVQVECAGYEPKVFSIGDVCAQSDGAETCRLAFIYAALKQQQP